MGDVVDDTRTRLVESALRLLREEGLDAVTLRAVGDLTGLSRMAPYRHFADKTALLAALAVRVIVDLSAHVAGAVLEGADRRERLRAFYTSYVEYAMEHRNEYRLVFASEFLIGHHPELERAIDDVMTALGLKTSGGQAASKAGAMALLSTAHGLAELATAGHFAQKGISYEDVIDVLVAP
ncbi:TetR/AcrR family transcriptional regulator [Streptosporangium roseum]|uniref:Transcriptional regulator, TetR family n=1 Tax=Streptosporangium roseum (strain ATCC 12428 / DSM 43021 / JCM 3005 / KCTC 9067 / NCIMB 10171 / NRRL 2505 / NI 9100) TaxID=479432 RepID=D2AR34_STRRD|nr:TetR/AcrR family transcriptional regulator [Streptosporangium roseum]ACZ88375.1 putative transcriptional regulator, TetR family [Streptosporangium roseum DSM 43021]